MLSVIARSNNGIHRRSDQDAHIVDRWIFRRFSLLGALDDGSRDVVRRGLAVSEVERGRRIYAPGDPAEHVHLIQSGVVKLGSPLPGGGLLILTFLCAGDLFGESAVLERAGRDHVAEAHENSIICSVPREPLLEAIRRTPALAYEMSRLMASRLRMCTARIDQLLRRGAHARIASALLALGRQFGARVGDSLVIPLRLTQTDLANLVGMRRETVNLVLQDLGQRGLVDAERRRIVLHDLDVLAAVR